MISLALQDLREKVFLTMMACVGVALSLQKNKQRHMLYTLMTLSFQKDISRQTVQTQIRL